jgi:hypothetical protein
MIYSSLNLFGNGQQPVVVSIYLTTVTNPLHPPLPSIGYTHKQQDKNEHPKSLRKQMGTNVCAYMLRLHNYSTVKSFEMEQRYSLALYCEKKTLPMTFL